MSRKHRKQNGSKKTDSKHSRKDTNSSEEVKRYSMTVGRTMSKLEFQCWFIPGKLRRGSSLTRNDKLNCLRNIGRDMERQGLGDILDLKPRHIHRYFGKLRDDGLSPGRMANHATAMRLLCRMMGKADIVPSNRVLGCSRDVANRTKNSDVRQDLEKAAEVRAALSENHKIAYDLARTCGLRQKETLLSHKIVNRDGVDYLVVEGSKGGRPRQIPITTVEQRQVLEVNSAYRSAHGGKLIDHEKSLKQGLKALQNDLSAAGATRTSGANMHTLRREWIIAQCELILSEPEVLREQMIKDLVEHIGHGRKEVLRAYTSLLEDDDGDDE